jgi:primosomal protein N'
MQLCEFAAEYYQRPFGEVALPAVPKALREAKVGAIDRAIKKITALAKTKEAETIASAETAQRVTHTLNEQQQQARFNQTQTVVQRLIDVLAGQHANLPHQTKDVKHPDPKHNDDLQDVFTHLGQRL